MALTVATNTGALMAQAAASSVNKSMETSITVRAGLSHSTV